MKDGRATSERETYRRVLRDLRRLYGRTPADEFSPTKLKAIRQIWIDKGFVRSSINRDVGRLIRVFKWGIENELVAAGVVHSLQAVAGLRKGRSVAKESSPVLPVDEAAIETTLDHLGTIAADMVRFQRLTGCRPDEVCQVRPMDLDRTGEVWTYKPESHKTEHHGRDRTIFIGPKAQAILAPYLFRDAGSFCFSPAEAEEQFRRAKREARKTPLSCGNRAGKNNKRSPKRRPAERYDTNGYRRAIHRACDRAKIPRWSPNRLRHAAATEIRHKFGLEASQVVLGHSVSVGAEKEGTSDWQLKIPHPAWRWRRLVRCLTRTSSHSSGARHVQSLGNG
ncbi:MAG: site-specific integrase [Planctomycetales bacterium]|nr:site-specific integrase [Planctomycetales bacterium]